MPVRAETFDPALLIQRPDLGPPQPRSELRVGFLGPAPPNQRRPRQVARYMPAELLTIFHFGEGITMTATWTKRLGYGKSRFVYEDPFNPHCVLKLALPGNHGDECAISEHLHTMVPLTKDCGRVAVKLNWQDSVDHLEVHALRSLRITPFDQYMGGKYMAVGLRILGHGF